MVGRGVPLNGYVRLIATTLLSVIAPFYVISRLIRTRHDASDAALFLALGGFINAVVAVFEARRGWPLYQAYYNALHVDMVGLSATLAIRAGFMRAQGALANPASLGLLLALALLAVLTLRSRFKPAGRYLVMALLSVGIAASQSRGAWIAALFGMCLYFLYNRRTMMLAAFGTIGSIALVIMAAAPSGSHLAQFLGRSGSGRQTAEYRSNLLSRGIQEVLAHPLVGQTRDQLEVTMNDLRQGEHIIDFVNTHLTIALTGGLFMFAAWMAAWSAPMLAGWRVRGWSAARREPGGIALPFAMIGACFACLTLTSTIDRMLPLTMLSIGLMSACVSLVKTTDGAVRRQAATRRHPALAPPMRSA